jgi:hypothetical protein
MNPAGYNPYEVMYKVLCAANVQNPEDRWIPVFIGKETNIWDI